MNEHMEQVVYVGPAIPSLGLSYGAVFLGGWTPQVQGLLTKCPWARPLFVPPVALMEAADAVTAQGSVFFNLASRLEEEVKGGKV